MQRGDGNGNAERGVLGDIERHAVGQLDGVVFVGAGFVKWDEGSFEGEFVLRSNGDCESVDDGGQNLKELSNPVVLLFLVQELVEDVVDRLSDGHTTVGQLPVDAVGHGLQTLPLTLV